MLKNIITVLVLAALAGTASAADIVELPAARGSVSFPHKQHQQMLKDCIKCHERGPGKIAELGRDWAHATCKGCHTQLGRGPVACNDCHHKG